MVQESSTHTDNKESSMHGVYTDDKEWVSSLFGSDQGKHACWLLDEVFEAFVLTNKSRYTLLDIVNASGKRYMSFWHANVPYRATVRQRNEDDDYVVQLQLPNNGFVYKPVGLQTSFSRHKSNTWRSLPANEALTNFPTIKKHCTELFDHGRVYYNHDTQCVDIQLQPKQSKKLPVFEISFEPGFLDEKAGWQPVFL